MKVIDLLNKIANGEEVPEEIWFWDRKYIFDKDYECYMCQTGFNEFIDLLDNHNDNLSCFLNDDVEIVEEELEPINIEEFLQVRKTKKILFLVNKINEIIDFIKGNKK